MDSYSILGIEKESSMEDIEKAYIDKISKIKKEVKNEKNAAAFEAVLTKAYNDILSQKENISEEQELAEEATDCEVDDLEYDEYEEYNDLDYDDFEDGQVVDKETFYRSFDEYDDYHDHKPKKRKKKKTQRRTNSKGEKNKKVKENHRLDDDYDKYKDKQDKGDERYNRYEGKNVKRVKEKKEINLFSIVLLPLKIMIVPIIIVLSILLILLKLISFAKWIVSKVLIVAAIAVTSIHGYQIYMGAIMDIRIFVVAAAVGISSIFIPYIVKTVPTIIEAINNKLKDFAF